MPNDTKTPRGKGTPFAIGNKGRPPGSLNKTTVAVQALLDGEAENITRKVVELAMEGNMAALRLCLERICPPRKEKPLAIEFPEIESAAELPKLTSAILAAVGRGELEPGQATALASLVNNYSETLRVAELERRISALEEENERLEKLGKTR